MKTVWTHIRRSPYQALAAVLVLSLTFFVISVVFGILGVSEFAIRHFESKPQITLFLKDSVKESEAQEIVDELKQDEKVASVKYISKNEALKIYQKQNAKDPLLLEMVTANILPASIEISTNRIEDLEKYYTAYKNDPKVEDIVYQKDIVSNLIRWTRGIRILGISYVLFHVILSFLVIMTIISMKVALKKEEIEIMQLVGASNSYIRLPFILEGMTYGLVGSLVATILFGGVLFFSKGQINALLLDLKMTIDPIFYALYFSCMLVFGLVLGWISSFLSVWRFLK